MNRRAVRVMLVVGLIGVIALAGAQLWRLDRERNRTLAEAREFDAMAQRLSRNVLSARASERAYVASGQGYAFWKPSVDRSLKDIREDLGTLKPIVGPELEPKIDDVLTALTEVTRLEARIAEHAAAGRVPHASDLIFADGLQASLALERATNALIDTHRDALDATVFRARWQEPAIAGAVAAAGLLVALLLLPLPERPETGAAKETGEATAPSPSDAAARRATDHTDEPRLSTLNLASATPAAPATAGSLSTAGSGGATRSDARGGDRSSVTPFNSGRAGRNGGRRGSGRPNKGGAPAGGSAAGANAPVPNQDPHAGGGREAASGEDAVLDVAASEAAAVASGAAFSGGDAQTMSGRAKSTIAAATVEAAGAAPVASSALEGAAALCSALACAGSARDLDSLLPAMARQLDAVGLIVWLKDEHDHTLKLALSYGYPEQTLAAVAAIDPAAENATARAARLAQPQIVPSSDSTAGALVIPMLTAVGCVGVVSIELPGGRERDDQTTALARIFAAQLAMLTA